jgi:hypothetical protein
MPFCQAHGLGTIALSVAAGFYCWLGLRLGQKVSAETADGWRGRKSLAVAVAVTILPLLLTLQPVLGKKAGSKAKRRGWSVKVIESKYFARFSQPTQNQAVMNPLYEFLGMQVPAYLRGSVGYQLTAAESLAAWREATGRAPADPRFPLLTTIHGNPRSGIENCIIIQVEGLSYSLLSQERNGRAVTPFLRRMARDGLCFSNTFQNANFTSGGVFSTLASVPKITFEHTTARFAGFEMGGHYGSLARVLDATSYTHFFCEGFRQSWDDFMAFSSRQGTEARGYSHFRDSLERKGRLAGADSLLGISDGPFLQECAELFLSCSNRFTGHCMTCTTHSPWAIPAGFAPDFETPALRAFAYFDASLQAFCERLQSAPAFWEKTMIVVLADHTSLSFGTSFLERLRIPLIFYGPRVPKPEEPDPRPASQVDVVPTILGMLPGEHPYAGLGRNLLDRTWPDTGIISGTTEKGFFLKDGYVLQYAVASGDFRLHALTNDTLGVEELSARQPEVVRRMRREYLGQIELVKRLAAGNRVFPLATERLEAKAALLLPQP